VFEVLNCCIGSLQTCQGLAKEMREIFMICAKGLPGSQSVADPEFPGGVMIHIPGTAEPEA
jgi:hypothetical protein